MVVYVAAFVVIFIAIWAGRVALLFARIKSFAKIWATYNDGEPKPDELVYIAIGDSTAQGIGASTVQQSYPWLVSKWLNKQTNSHASKAYKFKCFGRHSSRCY